MHDDQVLVAGSHYRLIASDLDGGNRQQFHLFLVIFERLLGKADGALLYLHVLYGVHQVPIDVLDLRSRRNHLVAKSNVSDLTVVLGDTQEPEVGSEPKSGKQTLSQCEAETRVEYRN